MIQQGVEPEQGAALVCDPEVPVTAGAGAAAVAVAAGGEVRAVGRVVVGLPDDDRVLAGLEHARTVRFVPERRLKRGQVEGAWPVRIAATLTCMMVRVLGP